MMRWIASRLRRTAYTCACIYILFGFQIGIQFVQYMWQIAEFGFILRPFVLWQFLPNSVQKSQYCGVNPKNVEVSDNNE